MRAAREAGINFLDDARYNDETGAAPIPTGYSEVVFGELFRASGWVRDEVVVANKLWWELWPEQTAAEELAASLGRMGLDHIDLIYATPPSDSLSVREVVESAAGIIAAGMARQWGVAMWSAAQLGEAIDIAAELGVPPPVANQLACSLVQHDGPDDPRMVELMSNHGVSLVASYVLAGGTLTGKYLGDADSRASGRASDDDAPPYGAGKKVAVALADLAREWGVATSQLAFCYALGHPCLASALFGATTPEQLRDNVASYDVFESLSDDQLVAVRALAT